MSQKLFIWLLLLVIVVPFSSAIGEEVLSHCNLSVEESIQINQLLEGGNITDDNVASIAPLADNCDLDVIPPSAWDEIIDNVDTSQLNIAAVQENPDISLILNTLVGASLCSFLTEENLLLGLEIPAYIPFTYDSFNFFLNGTPVAYLKVEDKKITEIDCGTVDYPGYELFISDVSVIRTILDADYPLETYRELKKNDRIKFEGTSFGRMLKVGVLNGVIGLMTLFN